MKLADDVIAIATSDNHLDEHAWADRPEISGDSMESFRWIVSLAAENNKPILAAGDMIDKPKNESAVPGFIREQTERLTQPIYYTQGQTTHDQQKLPWLSAVSRNAIWLNPDDTLQWGGINIGGRTVRGLDWQPAEVFNEVIGRLPERTNILLAHQVCGNLMGTIRLPEMYAEAIPWAQLVIMGDYHRHLAKTIHGNDGRDFTLLSPGSTNMRSIDEQPDKYVYLIKQDLSYESLQIPTRIVHREEVLAGILLDAFVQNIGTTLRKLEAASQNLPAAIRKPIIQVVFNPEIPDAYARIRMAIGDHAHLFTKTTKTELDEDEPYVVDAENHTDLADAIASEGAVACLPECVTEADDPVVFNLCRRLLEPGANPAAIIADVRNQYLGED